MAKGDDSVMRKKNKTRRKKMAKEGSNVSARIASIIAAKKRRQSGKLRRCEGMCFSLPTPDDPFNERNGKPELKSKDTKKMPSSQNIERAFVKGKTLGQSKETHTTKGAENWKLLNMGGEFKNSLPSPKSNLGLNSPLNNEGTKVKMNGKIRHEHQRPARNSLDCPSKFLMHSLNAIEKALREERTYNNDDDKPLFVSEGN